MVAIGRFSTNKRLDRLIEFFAALHQRHSAWRLKIAGRPADLTAEDVISLARAAGIQDAVEVIVSPTKEDIRNVMGDCSIIVSASEYEGFGLTAVEGLSAGLMPVLNDISPFRKLIEKTGVGVVLDLSDPNHSAVEFSRWWPKIERDYSVYREAAIASAAEYAWHRVGGAYEELYRSVLGISVRSILDVPVGAMTAPEAVQLLDHRVQNDEAAKVFFANAHTLNHAIRDKGARQALQRAIVFNDGVGVDLASRLLFGRRFPDNLNGTDFIPTYLKKTRHRYRIFLLGSRPGVAERAAARLSEIAPQHVMAGCHHGYFDAAMTDEILERIRGSRSDILLVAMGNPQQELWLTENIAKTGCKLGIGVGALFDFLAGEVPRAPEWMRKARLEWAYRMFQEPGRLWQRYLVGVPVFLVHVGKQWIAGPRVVNTRPHAAKAAE